MQLIGSIIRLTFTDPFTNYMKQFFYILYTFFGLLSIASAQINKPIGINLTAVEDYSTELVFTNAFSQSREWTPFNADGSGGWSSGINIPLRADGYPLEIPFNDGVNPPQAVRALMLWDIPNAFPLGNYRLIVQGSGVVSLSFGASGTYNCPIDTLVPVSGSVSLEIRSSLASDPIRNIQFIYPDYVNAYQQHFFREDFLDFLKDFQCIRFMDWLRTNNSVVADWSDRTPENYYTQAKSTGVAWEHLVSLANLVQKDIWINIPHRATDAYIQQLASFLNTHLDANLKIYVEYSNEVWNGIFTQNAEAASAAQNAGYTGQPWELAWKYTAKRSADIFKILEDVFVDDSRLIKVIPTQAGNSYVAGQIVSYFEDVLYNPHQVKADALAIAPYFDGGTGDKIMNHNLLATIDINGVLDTLENDLPSAFQFMHDNLTIANQHQLDLICYEGGQHLVASWMYSNNDSLTDLLTGANRHPRMGDLYCQYFDYWYENFGGMFAHFSSHGYYSKWGSWGIKETMQDEQNPKYLALQNCVFNDNHIKVNETDVKNNVLIFPNPSPTGVFNITFQETTPLDILVYDLLGRKKNAPIISRENGLAQIAIFESGVFIIKVGNNAQKVIVLQH